MDVLDFLDRIEANPLKYGRFIGKELAYLAERIGDKPQNKTEEKILQVVSRVIDGETGVRRR